MFKLKVVWKDTDLIECLVEAKSATFAGGARLYFTEDTLRQFARDISGFPKTASDRRVFSTKNSEAGNSLAFALSCSSALGAACASAQIVNAEETGETAHVLFPVEAGAVDVFERELLAMSQTGEGEAILHDAR